MEQFIMKGGNPLAGDVFVSGAKNAALGILAAAIMTDDTVRIDNLPDVQDVKVILQALDDIGACISKKSSHEICIKGKTINSLIVDNTYIKHIRAGYYLLGALLGKYHKAEVALPGGCNIGSRPIDQHIKGFRALGANVQIKGGTLCAKADRLVGTHIYLDMVSVGATINIMMAATMAVGRTVLENAAREPHVVDVANLLNAMGADIKGAGTDVIRIEGVKKLHGTTYSVIPDQIEAGTYMFAAAVTKGDVTIHNVIPKHLESITSKLRELGCEVVESDDTVRVVGKPYMNHTHVKTLPYPGFPTDMQPQITVALSISRGTSVVTESIFENRFKYVDELAKMGASIKVEGNVAVVNGVPALSGASVVAPDLRAGAALVIAGLAAEGITVVEDVEYIHRGYEDIIGKLKALGAEIESVDSEKEIQKFKLLAGTV